MWPPAGLCGLYVPAPPVAVPVTNRAHHLSPNSTVVIFLVSQTNDSARLRFRVSPDWSDEPDYRRPRGQRGRDFGARGRGGEGRGGVTHDTGPSPRKNNESRVVMDS